MELASSQFFEYYRNWIYDVRLTAREYLLVACEIRFEYFYILSDAFCIATSYRFPIGPFIRHQSTLFFSGKTQANFWQRKFHRLTHLLCSSNNCEGSDILSFSILGYVHIHECIEPQYLIRFKIEAFDVSWLSKCKQTCWVGKNRSQSSSL